MPSSAHECRKPRSHAQSWRKRKQRKQRHIKTSRYFKQISLLIYVDLLMLFTRCLAESEQKTGVSPNCFFFSLSLSLYLSSSLPSHMTAIGELIGGHPWHDSWPGGERGGWRRCRSKGKPGDATSQHLATSHNLFWNPIRPIRVTGFVGSEISLNQSMVSVSPEGATHELDQKCWDTNLTAKKFHRFPQFHIVTITYVVFHRFHSWNDVKFTDWDGLCGPSTQDATYQSGPKLLRSKACAFHISQWMQVRSCKTL